MRVGQSGGLTKHRNSATCIKRSNSMASDCDLWGAAAWKYDLTVHACSQGRPGPQKSGSNAWNFDSAQRRQAKSSMLELLLVSALRFKTYRRLCTKVRQNYTTSTENIIVYMYMGPLMEATETDPPFPRLSVGQRKCRPIERRVV